MSADRWLPLESNPDVINKFIHGMGVNEKYSFVDIYGTDEGLLQMVCFSSFYFCVYVRCHPSPPLTHAIWIAHFAGPATLRRSDAAVPIADTNGTQSSRSSTDRERRSSKICHSKCLYMYVCLALCLCMPVCLLYLGVHCCCPDITSMLHRPVCKNAYPRLRFKASPSSSFVC